MSRAPGCCWVCYFLATETLSESQLVSGERICDLFYFFLFIVYIVYKTMNCFKRHAEKKKEIIHSERSGGDLLPLLTELPAKIDCIVQSFVSFHYR